MKKYIFTLFLLVYLFPAFATHERAGEITYKWLYGLTYEVTIITYTYTPSPADRPELELHWGDGAYDIIQRVEKTNLPNNISRNKYTYAGPGTGGRHTFPAAGTYILWLEDPNRNAGIVNIPNSVNIPFYIETELIINPFVGSNSSPVLLNPPIDNACIYQPFLHNPWAYDPDGDSLSYRLDACKGQGGVYIPGFFYPPANNILTINPYTGELLWDSPQLNGEYNICIIIDEWRRGIRIGSVRRDMQINVVPCSNNPPVILPVKDTCVLAGTYLSYIVYAYDPDSSLITLTGNGAPLQISNAPAQFPQPTQDYGHISSVFSWQTECSHVKKYPYQMNFKVQDNGYPVQLVDFTSMNITVVGPAPENLIADAVGNTIELIWNKSICTNAVGYRIYRRSGYYGFIPGPCETGVPAYTGYQQIAQISNINDTTYTDDNNGQGLIRGNDYCYMVIAYYPDNAESYASLEACAELEKDVPVMTNVSIRQTDHTNGSVFVAWSKPTDFDTIQIPGPYKYLLYRAPLYSGSNYTLIDSLSSINDTTYIDSLLNTRDLPHHYKVDFYNDEPGNRFLVGEAYPASSHFLEITPMDNKLKLNWSFNIPWTNDYYTVYKQSPLTLLFDSIATVTLPQFIDTGLINGVLYCYYIKASGGYSAAGFAFPLINLSQQSCGVPTDNEPPCPPALSVTPDCELITNTLVWTNPNNSCADDVVRYNVYFSEEEGQDYQLIFTTDILTDTTYVHSGLYTIAGCYYVTAVDSFNNESGPSNIVCYDIDYCPLYELPNVFTPNGDGQNDLFIPFPYDFVDKIELHIYNRWGSVVFKTTDPDINWDGKCILTGNPCSEGVYYYVCDVYERRLKGIAKRSLTGFVHLLR